MAAQIQVSKIGSATKKLSVNSITNMTAVRGARTVAATNPPIPATAKTPGWGS